MIKEVIIGIFCYIGLYIGILIYEYHIKPLYIQNNDEIIESEFPQENV